MEYIFLHDKILPAATAAPGVSNRSYRYGDGLFETIRVVNDTIQFADEHVARLLHGASILGYEWPVLYTQDYLSDCILSLCRKNKCGKKARIRLSVYSGSGGLYDGDNRMGMLIECWSLPAENGMLNSNGLVTGIYPEARKSCDIFSNLKSANFLPYVMAARYARHNRLNDCFVMNTREGLADSTIANLFIIKDEVIYTPALSEGCVNGIIRQYLVHELLAAGYQVVAGVVSPTDLTLAQEVFLTNSISGMRWVAACENSVYTNKMGLEIYARFFRTIFTDAC